MIRTLFPSFVYEARLAPRWQKLNRELRTEARQVRAADAEGRRWSKANYAGGYTSYGSLDQLHRMSSTFGDLQKHLNRHVRGFVKHLEMDIDPSELQLSTCWVNIMPAGVSHTSHLHPLSVISGTYYVETPAGGGDLKFEDPRLEAFMASPPRKATASESNRRHVRVKPKPGQVILFESWMRHEVPANTGTKERVSISFNYDWIGR